MIAKAFDIFINNRNLFLTGIRNTLIVSIVGTVAGLLIGFVLSMLREMKIEPNDSKLIVVLKKGTIMLTNFYIEFVRGTPMMVQAVFLYYSLYKFIGWTPMVASLIIVSFNMASYLAEVLRSGIQSVNKGQNEAALALGMPRSVAFRKIVLPQALINAFPSIGNEFVVNIKDTSVLNAIQLSELYFQGMAYAGRTYQFSESMLILLVIYFILTYVTTRLLGRIEKALNSTRKINLELN